MELRNSLTSYYPAEDLPHQTWLEQMSIFVASAQIVMRAGLGWVFELGISPDMPFYQKKNLTLINRAAFVSLLLALPGTFLLILMGFSHPFSLLVSGVASACLILALNGSRRVEWSKIVFAYAPALIIVIFSLLELSSGDNKQALGYILARQGLCFGLLLPILIFGFEGRRKSSVMLAACMIIFLIFEVASVRLGAFQGDDFSGVSHGLFSVFSLVQYGGLAACVLYMQNYTMQHERQAQSSNQKLHHMAIRDGLTGLFNRSFIEQFIGDAINRSKRSGNPLALLMIDVDFFKQINDSLGHNAGDEALKTLAQVLQNNIRSTDYLGRWGGDELVLLLTDTNLPGAANLAEKLRRAVAAHSFPHNRQLTLSLGASVYQDGDEPTSFIDRADAAMYLAKRKGRNRVEVQNAAIR